MEEVRPAGHLLAAIAGAGMAPASQISALQGTRVSSAATNRPSASRTSASPRCSGIRRMWPAASAAKNGTTGSTHSAARPFWTATSSSSGRLCTARKTASPATRSKEDHGQKRPRATDREGQGGQRKTGYQRPVFNWKSDDGPCDEHQSPSRGRHDDGEASSVRQHAKPDQHQEQRQLCGDQRHRQPSPLHRPIDGEMAQPSVEPDGESRSGPQRHQQRQGHQRDDRCVYQAIAKCRVRETGDEGGGRLLKGDQRGNRGNHDGGGTSGHANAGTEVEQEQRAHRPMTRRAFGALTF